MTSKLEALVGFLAGRDDADAEQIRSELEDPAGEAALFLEASQELSRTLFGEDVLALFGRPSSPPTSPLPPAAAPVSRRYVPWLGLLVAGAVGCWLWYDGREQRRESAVALAQLREQLAEVHRTLPAVALDNRARDVGPRALPATTASDLDRTERGPAFVRAALQLPAAPRPEPLPQAPRDLPPVVPAADLVALVREAVQQALREDGRRPAPPSPELTLIEKELTSLRTAIALQRTQTSSELSRIEREFTALRTEITLLKNQIAKGMAQTSPTRPMGR